MAKIPKPAELIQIDYKLPAKSWMETKADIRPGYYVNAASRKWVELVDYPYPRDWNVAEDDWKLPDNWKEIVLQGMEDRLERFRSLKLFFDICVRCGACADKCHFFLGTGDPKNMPVMRAELMRSVYRRYFKTAGKVLGELAGARDLTEDVLKEWFFYLHQCTICRRCSVFCPYGIDMAEMTLIGRELLSSVGLNIDWAMASVAQCYDRGSHIGATPQAFKDMIDFLAEENERITGISTPVPINKKGAEILFIVPSGDYFADPGTYTLMGYLLLFKYIGLDYTMSTYAAEGGNFGWFVSHEMGKRLNAKMYEEAKRLKVKWILGGECGHMWRVCNQYMPTWFAPVDFLEEPVSPITGTKFETAKLHKMVHISEFTADLFKHGKLKVDPQRNAHIKLTFHDSCNPARAMGLLEEPRYIINQVLPKENFFEMPPNTIREKTFCCGSSAGLNANENMDIRMLGGLPRANAVKYVAEKYGVNHLGCVCALDRATLPTLMQYWVPEVDVTGITEMVGNALIFDDEIERTTDLRDRDLVGFGEEAAEEEEAE
ncbi:sulfate reduction electron transfer complex DsrMKJOP subunit DsrK [Desulfobacca acetoxidans]|uniref:4Fe-4S ferredoxin, iron-sulfur binding protein n=1 Tax=Desulfobacca acetoxidans (strain ATCC 700848 / DSM 11109 / ASRB2) TaxID=880072 RepID=F2NDX5_DESAR|nr:(Fe-S)-binding protein [Desulfobacca acetoxidans]AEB10543.1 4Fe-4S ferredoxin, iron-sulfur binding protein [Desulfobacca acetoxidans DSM 11109]